MSLSKITISGFKTFSEKTVIDFSQGINIIVGPNGCGKSNLVDAIKWVLGASKQKTLRSAEPLDVIFSGNNNKKAANLCKVELELAGCSNYLNPEKYNFDRMKIAKVISRADPVSKYYISDHQVRKKDIQNVFLGSGLSGNSYAIIEQGMVNKIIEGTGEDLKKYLDEAFGLSIYYQRKRETELKFNRTKQHLEVISTELNALLSSEKLLTEQSAAATLVHQLQTSLEQIQQAIQLKKKNSLIQKRDNIAAQKVNATEQSIQQLSQIKSYTDKIIELKSEIDCLEQKHHGIDEQYFSIRRNIQDLSSKIEKYESEASDNSAEVTALTKHLSNLKQGTLLKSKDLDRLGQERLEKLSSKEKLDDQKKYKESLLAQVNYEKNNVLKELDKLQLALNIKLKYKHDLDIRTNNTKNQLAKLEPISQQIQQHKKDQEHYQQEIFKNKQEIEELSIQQKGSKFDWEQEHSALQDLQLSLTPLNHKISELKQQIEANTALLYSYDKISKQYLADHKLEAGSNHLFNNLKVETEHTHLVSLILNNFLSAELEQGEYWVKPDFFNLEANIDHIKKFCKQHKLVNCSDLFLDQKIPYLMYYYVLLEDPALDLIAKAPEDIIFINKKGELFNKKFKIKPSNAIDIIFYNNEIIRLNKSNQTLGNELETYKNKLKMTEDTIAENKDRLDKLKNYSVMLEQKINLLNSQNNNISTYINSSKAKLQQYESEFTRLTKHNASLEELIVKMEQENKSLIEDLSILEKEINILKTDQTQLEQCCSQHESNIKDLDAALLATERKLLYIEADLNKLELSSKDDRGSIDNCDKKISSLQEQAKSLLQQKTEAEHKLKAASPELEQVEKQRLTKETERKKLLTSLSELERSLQEVTINHAKNDERVKYLNENLIKIGEELEAYAKISESSNEFSNKPTSKLLQLKEEQLSEIDKIGPVNNIAASELKLVKEKLITLQNQKDDIEKSIQQLITAIESIEKDTANIFASKFAKVNKIFSEYFVLLFNNGHGELMFFDEDGVQKVGIKAKPEGKKMSRLDQLSGGEKTLSAIAFIFALFSLNPGPFCLLDEIDAPLDDANVIRFTKLLTTISQKVQFILITHNKKTMQCGNTLLGVSMAVPGSSVVLPVNMETGSNLVSKEEEHYV